MGLIILVSIGDEFQLKENIKIKKLDGLDRWKKAMKIDFQDNNQLEEANQLAQLTNLRQLSLKRNKQLKELPDLIVDSLF